MDRLHRTGPDEGATRVALNPDRVELTTDGHQQHVSYDGETVRGPGAKIVELYDATRDAKLRPKVEAYLRSLSPHPIAVASVPNQAGGSATGYGGLSRLYSWDPAENKGKGGILVVELDTVTKHRRTRGVDEVEFRD